MELSQSLRTDLHQRQELTLEQRHAVKLELEQRLLGLISAVRDFSFTPKGVCPNCSHKMDSIEILEGFSRDPKDPRTTCPKCKHQFSAKLVVSDNHSSVEILYYCPDQVLEILRIEPSMTLISPSEFRQHHAAVFHSAVRHFGSLTSAYEKVDVKYLFQELPPEEELLQKAEPFMGTLSDSVIARVIRVHTKKVYRYRKAKGIKAYNRSDVADEVA